MSFEFLSGPVHVHQRLSLFHAHYDARCLLPIHVYHIDSGKPVTVLLRPGKTPSGAQIRTLLKHLVPRIAPALGAMSATAFSSTPWRRTKGSRTRRCVSIPSARDGSKRRRGATELPKFAEIRRLHASA